MSSIRNYFKTNQLNAIEKSFLQQCEEKTEITELDRNEESWAKEKTAYEDKIIALESEKKNISLKYERLKEKHVHLLQLLMQLETKNQKLELFQAKKQPNQQRHHQQHRWWAVYS